MDPENEAAWVPYRRDGERQPVPGLMKNIVTGKLRYIPPPESLKIDFVLQNPYKPGLP
jgi:hypothetical protein